MSIGIWQVLLILVIVLIIFGAGKLPQVMGDVAKGVRSFKAGLKDDQPRPVVSDAAAERTRCPPRRTRQSAARGARLVSEYGRCSTSAGRRWPSS